MRIKLLFSLLFIFVMCNFSFAQNSGVWTASGSGASTTWSTAAGTVNIVASATNYGSGTGYTLNDFVTYDTMGCAGAYSEPSIGGNPSLSVRHTFPNTAQITFNFDKYVIDPVLNLDRLGGGIVNNLTSSSLIKVITPGVTFTELSENDVHFISTSTTVERQSGQTYSSLPSECGPPTDGTASGSIRLNGVFNTVTFEISMSASGTTNSVNDRWELAFSNVVPLTGPISATIDFDGVDDYLDTAPFITNWTQGTIMGWIKIEGPSSATLPNIYSIAGQESMRLFLTAGRTPSFAVIDQSQVTSSSNYPSNNIQVQPDPSLGISLQNDLWYHVTGVFNTSNQTVKLYLNGELVGSATDAKLNSQLITKNFDGSPHIYSTREFTIGRYPTNTSLAGFGHFNGDIDEVRVFDSALTEEQIQKMVYQEIENSSGFIRGTIIPKDIIDYNSSAKVSWSNLKGYYPMTDIANNFTNDHSLNGNDVKLHNILTIQDQTAPMPYQTAADGSWTSMTTWLHGDIWDICDMATKKSHSIVSLSHNVSIASSIANLGLMIDNSKTLTVNGDNEVKNSWYFDLSGTLDLQGDSQLIQTETSDLVTSSQGKILRRQEGTSNPYWYNYWASPVGTLRATSFRDNNTSSNNTNNSVFNIRMLKDESGFNLGFTTTYASSGYISTYWLFTYINGVTYYDWAQITQSSDISPGVGYTQKGTDITLPEQQYIFEGKPNNGTILVDVEDRGGAGSVAGTSKTEFLLGNPYPSALDVHEFIDDNAGVIDGTLQLWQQWSGTSHNLSEYNGGYAQINKTGAVRASQFVGLEGATTGGLEGTKVPTRYLPVGQGFITEIVADGTVEFNNGQRIFIKESDANGNYNNGSVFMKGGNKKTGKNTESKSNGSKTDSLQKIRLEFSSVTGPDTKRELLLGFSDQTTDGYDYGYDAETHDASNNDLNLAMEGKSMNIQAYSKITADKVVPLNFRSSGEHTFEIKISELENIPEDQDIYLRDNLTGEYFNLREDQPYRFTSEQGIFNLRLEVVFQDQASTLSTEEASIEENYIYYDKGTNSLYAKQLEGEVTRFTLYSITGQSVMELADVERTRLTNGLELPNMASGTYIAVFRTDTNNVITKKLVKN